MNSYLTILDRNLIAKFAMQTTFRRSRFLNVNSQWRQNRKHIFFAKLNFWRNKKRPEDNEIDGGDNFARNFEKESSFSIQVNWSFLIVGESSTNLWITRKFSFLKDFGLGT